LRATVGPDAAHTPDVQGTPSPSRTGLVASGCACMEREREREKERERELRRTAHFDGAGNSRLVQLFPANTP